MHVLLFIRPLELFHFAWIKFYIPDSPWPPLLLLLLSHFSRVLLCATPETAAHQTPQSLGFSRQEHWSGLPFPSPMHESEKWKWGRSVVSDSSWPHGLKPTRLLCPWDFPGKSTGVGCHCLLRKWDTNIYQPEWLILKVGKYQVLVRMWSHSIPLSSNQAVW